METGSVKLLFDENFSHNHVRFVHNESGLGVLSHTRLLKFSGLPDKDWIPLAVAAGFIIVTGDRNDKTREFTVQDLKDMGARVILVGPFWDHQNRWAKAKWLVAAIERIVNVASTMPAGSVRLLVDKHVKVREL